jgi:sugar lactone lactonase YvrE
LTVASNGKIFVAGAVSNNGFLIESGIVTVFIDENSVESNTPPGVELDTPSSAAVDSANFFYIAGGISSNVFRVTPSPQGGVGVPKQLIDTTGDGEANVLNVGRSIVADSSNNIFVTGVRSNNVLRVTPEGVVSEVIDSTGDTGGPLDSPFSLAVDSDDNVYVAGLGSNNVLQITPTGVVTKIIDDSGVPPLPGQTNNTDEDDELDAASSVIVDSNDDVYVAGFNSNNVFRIAAVDGLITEIIRNSGDGTGDNTGDNELLAPNSLAFDSDNNIFVSGANSNNVFKITLEGVITEIIDFTGDRLGIGLDRPEALAVDSLDNVYVAGFNSNNVFKIDTPGTCSTGGTPCTISTIIDATGDGAGNVLEAPTTLTVDSDDNVYIAGIDSDNVFQVTPLGVITEIIDALGDDEGNEIIRPGGLAVDSNDDVYVSGQVSDNVIKITPAPVVP